MNLQEDYLEYVGQFSLALLAVSAAYFFDPSVTWSYGTLLLLPLLFGHTAYVSKDSFRFSSMLGLISLIFAPLGIKMAGIASVLGIGNIFVSFFARGTSFKDYYGSTMLPLLITGLILGAGLYGAAVTQPSIGENVRTTTADLVGNQTNMVLEQTDLIEIQKQSNERMVSKVSEASVLLTANYTLQRSENLSRAQQLELQDTMRDASREVPKQLVEKSETQIDTLEIPRKASQTTENLLQGKNLIVLIPIVTFGLYSIQPIVGLLTAISATGFSVIGREEEE